MSRDHAISRDEVMKLAKAGNGPARITAIMNSMRPDPFQPGAITSVMTELRRAGLLPPHSKLLRFDKHNPHKI
jgi:hypothetical protein